MNFRKQSSTNYPFTFFMTQSSDHISGATGLSPAVQVSKNGGTFAAASGAVTELGGGWYSWAGNATDRNTLGELSALISAGTADTVPVKLMIVPWDSFDGNLALTALPSAAAGANGGLPTVDANNGVKISSGTGTGQLVLTSGLVRSDQVTGNVAGSVGSISGVSFPTNFGTLAIANNLLDVNVTKIAGQDASQSGVVDANVVSINGSVFAGANVPSEVADGSLTAGKFAINAIDSTVLADGSITANKIAANAITATTIATGALTSAKFAANAIDSTVLANGTITAGKFAASAIDATAIANNAITADKLATGAIAASKFAANAITSTVVADSTLTTSKFGANAITSAVVAADALDDIVVEGSYNLRQVLSLMASVLLGKVSGADTLSITMTAVGSDTPRIVATVDSSGNRSSLTLTPPT